MGTRRIRIIISGRVHGVFFRVSLRDQARGLGVSGWVRNDPDGTVEALIEGESGKVDQLINWCWNGPPDAIVENISKREDTTDRNMSSFDIID